MKRRCGVDEHYLGSSQVEGDYKCSQEDFDADYNGEVSFRDRRQSSSNRKGETRQACPLLFIEHSTILSVWLVTGYCTGKAGEDPAGGNRAIV